MFVEVGNSPIYVDVVGEGEPALFLHGVPDSAELWRPLLKEVSSDYRCYVTDLPGFYRSEIPQDYRFELKAYGQYVNQLVETLEIPTPFTLVAHDWGGIFALSFACQFPEKVKRVVGGSFPFSHLYKWHPWARVWQTPILGELSMLLANKHVFRWEMKRGGALLTTEQIDHTYSHKLSQWKTRSTILKLYRSADPRKFLVFQNDLERLSARCNIEAVWGQKDKYVPSYMADMMHAHTKNILPEAGHWVPLEAPEELAAVLR
jgi:pimeloyl-ACP methyl ester carboxylesterase